MTRRPVLPVVSPASDANAARATKAIEAGYAVRPMRCTDIDRVGAIHVEVWRQTYPSVMAEDYLSNLDAQEFSARWRDRLSDPAEGRHLVGVDPNGRMVAIGSGGPSHDLDRPTEWELLVLNLLASDHGTGLADLMMVELAGSRPCWLWVVPSNDRALRFYRRHGFTADGHTTIHPPTGLTVMRLVRGLPR